jgi:hypothetical protein
MPLWTGAHKLVPKGIRFPGHLTRSGTPADIFRNQNEQHIRYSQNIFIPSLNHGFYSIDFDEILIA